MQSKSNGGGEKQEDVEVKQNRQTRKGNKKGQNTNIYF